MGGRGSYSAGKPGRRIAGPPPAGGRGFTYIGGDETRTGITTLFEQTGFSSMTGTGEFDTALLGSYGWQLNRLEHEYGAIGMSETVSIAVTKDAGFVAAVSYRNSSPENQELILNHKYLGKTGETAGLSAASSASGHSMSTDGSLKNNVNYAVTHEYGHILQNAMYAKASAAGYKGTHGDYKAKAKREIMEMAREKYGLKESQAISRYGSTNSAEFFAEAFAGANLGAATPLSKAADEWIKRNL